jgi:hypothetical protein
MRPSGSCQTLGGTAAAVRRDSEQIEPLVRAWRSERDRVPPRNMQPTLRAWRRVEGRGQAGCLVFRHIHVAQPQHIQDDRSIRRMRLDEVHRLKVDRPRLNSSDQRDPDQDGGLCGNRN